VRSGDVWIAYQVAGEGPFDLVFVPPFVTHIELIWRIPSFAPVLAQLASFSRLIRFDKRGTGMSDRVSGAPSLETQMDDVRAVMDAVGSIVPGVAACASTAHRSEVPKVGIEPTLPEGNRILSLGRQLGTSRQK
jgi:pimeloyl-ACP methyl ester carboxylesterase